MRNTREIKEIMPETYCISEWGGAFIVYMFLLVGKERALLIDSGYGGLDLPQIIGSVTDKPVIHVCSHGHIDHAMGTWMFEKAYLHSSDFDVFNQSKSRELQEKVWNNVNPFIWKLARLSPEQVEERKKRVMEQPDANLFELENLDAIIELGQRPVRWIHTPGHTRGSVMFIDSKTRTLFSGDSLCSNVWLCMPESTTVTAYRDMLLSLRSEVAEHNIKYHCPCHGKKKENIRRLNTNIKMADALLASRKKCKYTDNGLVQGYQYGNGLLKGILFTEM